MMNCPQDRILLSTAHLFVLGILKHLRSACGREQFDEDPSIELPNVRDVVRLQASLYLPLMKNLGPTTVADREKTARSSHRGDTFAVLSLQKTYFLKLGSYLHANSNGFHSHLLCVPLAHHGGTTHR